METDFERLSKALSLIEQKNGILCGCRFHENCPPYRVRGVLNLPKQVGTGLCAGVLAEAYHLAA